MASATSSKASAMAALNLSLSGLLGVTYSLIMLIASSPDWDGGAGSLAERSTIGMSGTMCLLNPSPACRALRSDAGLSTTTQTSRAHKLGIAGQK